MTAEPIDVWETEDHAWALGLHAPNDFLAAVDALEREQCGYQEDELISAWAAETDVRHLWALNDPDLAEDDEVLQRCEPDEPGAWPYTLVALP